MYGEEYKPDAASIAANIITSILFGSLEAFKNNPKAAELQNRLKQGDVSAQKETADFLNKQADNALAAQERAEEYINQGPKAQGVESGDINGYNWDSIYEEAVNGAGDVKFSNLDDFFNNPKKFGDATPNEWYQYFKDNGYNPQPMSKGGLGGVPLDQGGGFKVNWSGDRIWEYHPSGLNHHGGDAYYKISSGKTGKMWFDMNGNPLPK